MEWLTFLLVGLFLLVGICLLLAVPLVKHHPVQTLSSPADYDLRFEEVNIPDTSTLGLKGWWIPSPASTRTLILLHGYAGSMDPDLHYAPHLHTAGYNLLMFDFRAHGRSPGRLTSLGALESLDVQAAVKFALTQGSRSIGLLGFSMGGRAAILAAPFDPAVKAIISDGGPARLVTAITQDLALRKIPFIFSWILARMILAGASLITGVNLFKRDPINGAKELTSIPVLFIHGEKDRYTTLDEMKTMLTKAGSMSSLWLVPEAKHRNIEDTRPEEYLQKVINFFKAYL